MNTRTDFWPLTQNFGGCQFNKEEVNGCKFPVSAMTEFLNVYQDRTNASVLKNSNLFKAVDQSHLTL